MRFPRFHFGTAIALGLMMLCMSSVPVFADGISAPTLSASLNGSTISLSWNVPGGTNTFMLRRSMTAFPANSSDGELISTFPNTTTSYDDTGRGNGTYYYSVFAINGGLTSAPGSAGPVTVDIADTSSSSSETTVIHRGGGRRGSPGRGGAVAPALQGDGRTTKVASSSSSHPAAYLPPWESGFHKRTCERVLEWFRGDEKMLSRVNERLQKRFGFTCKG